MPHPNLAVVTGAFSYTGRYVTRRLLDQGVRVRTLTRSPDAEDPFGGRVEVAPLDFSDADGLRRSMQGAGVFYNTYWIRYAHGRITFDLAVENTRTLFEAAESAGVGRIVHFSVTNPSSESALPYFRGKARSPDIEYRLLAELSANAGRILTHEQLLRGVWGHDSSGGSGPVRAIVRRLRRKLGAATDPTFIVNKRHVGYWMEKGETLEREGA